MGVEGLVDRIKPSLERKTLPGRRQRDKKGTEMGYLLRVRRKRRLDLIG